MSNTYSIHTYVNAEEEEERRKLEAQKREEERLALMRMADSERQEYLRMY